MDLTEAEDIKKRWQEYTEELYKNLSCIMMWDLISWPGIKLEPHALGALDHQGSHSQIIL